MDAFCNTGKIEPIFGPKNGRIGNNKTSAQKTGFVQICRLKC